MHTYYSRVEEMLWQLLASSHQASGNDCYTFHYYCYQEYQ